MCFGLMSDFPNSEVDWVGGEIASSGRCGRPPRSVATSPKVDPELLCLARYKTGIRRAAQTKRGLHYTEATRRRASLNSNRCEQALHRRLQRCVPLSQQISTYPDAQLSRQYIHFLRAQNISSNFPKEHRSQYLIFSPEGTDFFGIFRRFFRGPASSFVDLGARRPPEFHSVESLKCFVSAQCDSRQKARLEPPTTKLSSLRTQSVFPIPRSPWSLAVFSTARSTLCGVYCKKVSTANYSLSSSLLMS